ncbi:nucleolar MIF4G domain-containing protein 1 [Rhinoderma darwinii]|uniref:nucleolar MIF4G domain-containing protein 1 n=1 Tax=Rhinoderma darwinii TaxID=43563 RepID=UPI003F67E1A1
MGMKRKNSGHIGPQKIKKLQLSVQEFVEKAEGRGGLDEETRGSAGFSATRGRAKNRKELRKEKRQSKKIRRKAFYERKFPGKQGPQGATENEQGGSKDGNLARKKPPAPAEPAPDQKSRKNHPVEKATDTLKRQVSSKKKISKEEARKKSLLEANEKEEKEIQRLEKSLRMNKRRNKSSLPQAFTQDGLDYILGVLEPGDSTFGLYDDEEEEANTAAKLHKLSENVDEEETENDSDEEESGKDEGSDEEESGKNESSDEEESGKDEEEEANTAAKLHKLSENVDEEESEKDEDSDEEEPEIGEGGEETYEDIVEKGEDSSEEEQLSEEDEAMEQELEDSGDDGQSGGSSQLPDDDVEEPVVINKIAPDLDNKYVPPHLRPPSDAADAKKREELERLRKSVKGLMNRLSEPIMASISGQLEQLYMTNSRKDMNDTLSNIVLDACITPAKMPDRLMMEHVLLISILHHTVGIEVGAHILETVVKQFHEQYEHITGSKECDNLITFIGHLYNFHIIDCRLVFDILKLLVSTFTERNIELILLLLKNVGFSLRKDDALALKELICEAQSKASAVDKKFQDQSRARFMLEIMLALKNNDMRKIPGYDPEPVEKLRKLQRSLVHNSMSGSDTRLRVSLENILDADKVGRWWIVGSSWSGAPMIGQSSAKASAQAIGKVSAKIMDLARKQRMNTDIRRNIFCVVMTSEDYLDAFEKLLKLGLKDHQEREIVHVLIDCCLQEKTYNPFYAFLSSKFCEYDRRFLMTFQFSMWDKFRDLGSLSATTFSNLTHFLSHLIKSKSLPLSIFKVIEFSELDKIKVSFLRQVLYKLLMDSEADDLAVIFGKVSDNPKLGMLREGLKLFISHFLLKNVCVQKTPEEAELLTQRADLAVKGLQAKESKLRL